MSEYDDWEDTDLTGPLTDDSTESEDGIPYRRHPAVKYIAGIILLAFIAFAFPQIRLALNSPYDFLEHEDTTIGSSMISDAGQAVVAVEAIDNPLLGRQEKKGTGFNLTSDGLVLTNEHIVSNANRIKVQFPDGLEYYSNDFWSIEGSDMALIKLEGNNLPIVSLDMHELPDPGNIFTVIGNPLGLEQIVLNGILDEYCRVPDFDYPVMRLDITCQPGSSGSPVLNEDGKAVAIVFAITTPPLDTEARIQTLAIPLYNLKEHLNNCLDAHK